MRRLFFILLIGSTSNYSFAQNKEEVAKIFIKVENEAHTDQVQLTKHIKVSIDLPDSVFAKIPAGTYRAEVEFIIDTHGYMGQFKLVKDPGYGLGGIALQIMKKISWKMVSGIAMRKKC